MANLISSGGYQVKLTKDSTLLSPSEFNSAGYFEDTKFTLLNDQLIRMSYGSSYSFLHTPTTFKNLSFKPHTPENEFHYDLDEKTVSFPARYEGRLKELTGHDWDPWGLTRMRRGEKWYKCYSRYKCENRANILLSKKEYCRIFRQRSGLVVKDPRLALTFHSYNITDAKVIFLRRSSPDNLVSMRNHYGPNMFTSSVVDDHPYVSNHFNYKIKPQTYDNFRAFYESQFSSIEQMKTNDFFSLTYEDLLSDTFTQRRLCEFLGVSLNFDIIEKGDEPNVM